MTDEIEIGRRGSIQTLRFARAAKKNAITQAMYGALSDALTTGDEDPDVMVHVFLGSDGIFSAGNDLNDFLANATGDGAATNEVLRFIGVLPTIRKPMVAAVDGLAVGIAVTLLFHCDLVYASTRSTFSTPFLDLGLVPENASSLLAPRLMGHARAFELLVLGETFDADRAREAGFVNALFSETKLETAAFAAAERLAAKPPEALRISRALLRGDERETLTRSKEEAQLFGQRLKSPEAREAFTAFLEKRPPKFSRS